MKISLCPWDNGEKPFWTNPENGYQWYVDKSTTEWCSRETLNTLPVLDAVCFIVCSVNDGHIEPLSRILIDKNTNKVLHEDTSMENMATKIDMLRFIKSTDKLSSIQK